MELLLLFVDFVVRQFSDVASFSNGLDNPGATGLGSLATTLLAVLSSVVGKLFRAAEAGRSRGGGRGARGALR